MARFTITINATLNGKTCKNPQIEFIQGSDVIYPCEISGNQITIETLPGTNPNACIEGYIKCDDDCLNCPPQYFKKCLCNDVTLLNSCQICKDGLIEEICTPEEIAAGKICSPNGCICPPDKPVTDPNTGQCVQCITGTVADGGCRICLAGSWVYIDCAPNTRCVNGECECIPPYVKDPLTGECKLQDECLDDEDCPTCKTCILGKCEPVVCPEGFQCINDECVPACTNVNCNNGADCGENCGCLDGKCVPCTILSCLDEASCQAALGCKCTGDDCVPVDNCKQYCDGNTPCLDDNCTCYNNECVSCENFPCEPDECSDKYNCGCKDGKCEGGEGCNDSFELKKNENCEADGCELEATFTTEKGCNCDPIEFKTKNVFTIPIDQVPNTGAKIMELNVEMFKNGVKYSDFKNIATMGDDEIVDATVKVIVTHRVNGLVVTPNVAPVAPVSANGSNVIPNIPINFSHVTSTFNGNPTVVTIEVRAENVKVPNNSCINYKSDTIATYELDFRTTATWSATKNIINGSYKNVVSRKLTDGDSTRRPLFIWYKSNTGNFALNKYQNNGTYNQNGFFRKEYGVASGGGAWKDKVNNPARQTTPNQSNELWNNLNYKVTVDCGCGGGTGAVLNNVVFCCTEKIKYNLSNCNTTITIPPFNVCSVNKNLAAYNATGYKTPEEAQTYFWMIINGTKEVVLRAEGGEVINSPFTYTHNTSIESITFEQRYKGSPLVQKSCEVSYTEDYTGPDYNVVAECGKITVTKLPSSPNITTVTGKKGTDNISFISSQNGTVWTATSNLLKTGGEVEVTVSFQGSCALTKKVSISCPPDISAIPTDNYAKGSCQNGTDPNIVAEVTAGFTTNVKFSIDGVNYVSPDTTTPTIKKTFTSLPAGTYTIYAKETINGQEVIATKQVTILPVITPSIIKKDICGNNNGEIKLTGGSPGSVWKVTGLGVSNQFSLNANGDSTPIAVPFTGGGVYVAELISDAKGASCFPQSLTITINKDGGQITPQIIFQNSSICRGGEVLFRIEDGGSNLTYNVQVDGQAVGFITNLNDTTISQVTASGSFNAKLKLNLQSNATSATIRIVSIAGQNTCFTLTPSNITSTIAILDGPAIGKHTITCSQQLIGRYNVTVEVFGTATEVTINGVQLLPTAPNTWTGQDIIIPGAGLNVNINASNNGTCPDLKSVFLQDCSNQNDFCPSQEIQIVASPQSPTCGSVEVTIGFLSSNITPLAGEEYAWYEIIGNVQSMVTSGTIVGIAPPPIQVLSDSTPREYMLAIKTKNGACEYYSNIVEVVAGTALNPIIFGPGISPDTTPLSTGNTYTYSTGLIPGATYSWTLTNSNGSNQPIGTNSNTINISSFAGGPNTINVTVTSGACTGSSSAIVNVGLTCPQVSVGYVAQSGDNTCKNLAATINNSPVGVTPVSYIWLVDGVPTQTGTGVPANFDASVIPAGDTVDITLEVTFSNGCLVTGPINPITGLVDPFEYTRCACLCNNGTCQNTNVLVSGSGGTGLVYTSSVYPSNQDIQFRTWTKSYRTLFTENFKIVSVNGVTETTLLETGYPYYTNDGGCPTTSHPTKLVNLSSTPITPGVTDIGALVYDNPGTIPVIVTEFQPLNIELEFTVTIPAGEFLRVYHNDVPCSNQADWRFYMDCV